MKGNFHVQFLGEGVAATSPPYPTPGWATTQVYPASKRRGFVASCRLGSGWFGERRRPDSNRGWRFCRPLPYHLATAPR